MDQLAKLTALALLEPGLSIDVIGPLLRWTLVRNSGAAFGMGSQSTVVFSVFACIALAACLFYFLPRITRLIHAVVLGMFIAGISGNLWDRLFREPAPLRGHVVDFIHVPVFAIFNVADIFITCAAIIMVWHSFQDQDRPT